MERDHNRTIDRNRNETENNTDSDSDSDGETVSRRRALRTIGAGAALLTGIGAASAPAAARVPHPTVERKAKNLSISGRQSTRLGYKYTYIVNVTNHSRRSRRIVGSGYGDLDVRVPRTIGGKSTVRYVFQSRRPLKRIVFR